MEITRFLNLKSLLENKSHYLFGPRQTGKTSLILKQLSDARIYNLLESETFLKLSQAPSRLRQEAKHGELVVIDEIQKLPALLDEVQIVIEERHCKFLLTGSSARKLRRGGSNLLGGRLRSMHLHPLTIKELGINFNLQRALQSGMLPSIYFSDNIEADLRAYAGDYLKEEIAAEASVRNIEAFSRFLHVVALSNGNLINFTELASDAQVKLSTLRNYTDLLSDTLIGTQLPAWTKSRNRKAIQKSKLYLFDIGVTRILQGRKYIGEDTKEFGDAFEALIFQELSAYLSYTIGHDEDLSFWRSTSGFEVDFILGDTTAIEVKSSRTIHASHFKGLRALKQEGIFKNYVLVSREENSRIVDEIKVLSLKDFIDQLWSGAFV